MDQVKTETRAARYERISEQLLELFAKGGDVQARMATAVAVLHHKMPHFFWTGFYRVIGEELVAAPYQGPVACAILPHGEGVCWACVMRGESIVVPNVHEFPGHIPCDSRSNSEVVVPVRDSSGEIVGVLDVDSTDYEAFSEVDAAGLERIAAMIYTYGS